MLMSDPVHKTLLGLVGASGSGASSAGQSDEWKLIFRLTAWRFPGAEVVEQERICAMPIPASETQAWMQRVQAYDVIEIEIEGDADGPAIRVVSILRTGIEDAALKQIAADLRKPIIIARPDFGELRYDRQFGWYTGKAAWNGRTIDISLSCADPRDAEAVLEAASRLFKDQAGWQQRVQDYAVANLLELKNDSWLDDNETELSREEFLSKMTLESITIEEAGSFTFWHDDGDLFFGHSIEIDGDLENGLTNADIPG